MEGTQGHMGARQRVTGGALLAAGLLAFLSAAFAMVLSAAFAAEARADNRPNILLILTDDQRLDGTMAVMPKTRQWFKTGGQIAPGDNFDGGLEFSNAVDTTPLCCPARTTIMTGQYAHTHGTRQNDGGANFEANWTNASLQAYLQGAGYRTGIVGRYFPGWTRFDTATADTPPPFWNDWSLVKDSSYSGLEVTENGMRKFVWRYETDYIAKKADDFLNSAATAPNHPPWFLYLAPNAPHGPHRPAPKYADANVPALDDTKPSYFEKDRRDKPGWVASARADSDTLKKQWKAYLRTLLSVDDMVDAVMRKLHSLNNGQEERNTLAFFTSDNGYMFGEHGLTIKEKPYLESIQVPFYMRWPDGNVPKNAQDNVRLVGNVDIAPTVIDAINRAQPGSINPIVPMEGVSLVNPWQVVRSRMLTEHCGVGPGVTVNGRDFAPGAPLSWASIHNWRFQYIENYKTGGDSTGGCAGGYRPTDFSNIRYREYYDLVHDPTETDNLLADDDPTNDPPVNTLHAELEKDRTCTGTDCVPNVHRPLEVPVEVKFTSGPDDPSGDPTPTFMFTTDRPALALECRWALRANLASAAWSRCQSPFTIASGISPGNEYGFSVRQKGELNTDSKDYFWHTEQAPDTHITNQPAKLAKTTTATFDFASTQNGSNFRCKLDALAEEICDAGTITYNSLAQGPHHFEVYAVNGSGTESVSAKYDWSIDSIAPDTQPIQPLPTSSTHRTSVTFAITCTPSLGAPCSDGSDSRDVQFECRLYQGNSPPANPPPFSSCGGQLTTSLNVGGNSEVDKVYTGLQSNSSYTFEARTIDRAGNQGPVRSLQWNTSSSQDFATVPDTSWPEITVGNQVNVIVPDGSGGFFVGGDFSRAGTTAQDFPRTDLMHVASDGTVDPNWHPATNTGAVKAMTLNSGVLYVGGSFTQIDGFDHHRIAAIDAVTGNVINTWAPDIQDGEVRALAIGPPMKIGDPVNTIYAGGSFLTIAGVTHRGVAQISLADGTTAADAWDPGVVGGSLEALAVTERYVYLGGENVNSVGGDIRSPDLREIERTPDASATEWLPDPRTATGTPGIVYSLRVKGTDLGELGTLFVGGTFDKIGVPFNPTDPQPARKGAAEVNLSDTGSVTGWDPSLTLAGGNPGPVRDFVPLYCTADGENANPDPTCTSVVAGDFDNVGTASRPRLAETDRTSGTAADWNPAPDGLPLTTTCWPDDRCDIAANRILAVGGQFTTIGGISRQGLAFFRAP